MIATIIYDVKRREIISDQKLGVSGFMSYDRLISTLKEAGEFLDDEKLSQVQFDSRGLTFGFEDSAS